MPYSSRCSICNHKQSDLINDLCLRRALGETEITYQFIIRKVDELGGPHIEECTLSRHINKHFDVAAEGRKRATEQYNEASDKVATKTLGDLELLDAIRDLGAKMMIEGDLKPDMKDVLNAIKVKHGTVMKDDNPLAAIIDALAGVSLGE